MVISEVPKAVGGDGDAPRRRCRTRRRGRARGAPRPRVSGQAGDHRHQLGVPVAAPVEVVAERRDAATELVKIACPARNGTALPVDEDGPDVGVEVVERRHHLHHHSPRRCADPVGPRRPRRHLPAARPAPPVSSSGSLLLLFHDPIDLDLDLDQQRARCDVAPAIMWTARITPSTPARSCCSIFIASRTGPVRRPRDIAHGDVDGDDRALSSTRSPSPCPPGARSPPPSPAPDRVPPHRRIEPSRGPAGRSGSSPKRGIQYQRPSTSTSLASMHASVSAPDGGCASVASTGGRAGNSSSACSPSHCVECSALRKSSWARMIAAAEAVVATPFHQARAQRLDRVAPSRFTVGAPDGDLGDEVVGVGGGAAHRRRKPGVWAAHPGPAGRVGGSVATSRAPAGTSRRSCASALRRTWIAAPRGPTSPAPNDGAVRRRCTAARPPGRHRSRLGNGCSTWMRMFIWKCTRSSSTGNWTTTLVFVTASASRTPIPRPEPGARRR